MITAHLPVFTSQQIWLVIRILNADREDVAYVYQATGRAVLTTVTKQTMLSRILSSLDNEKVQRALVDKGLAVHSWFGFETPRLDASFGE
jgi:hypothetical protein